MGNASGETDKKASRQTDTLITILRNPVHRRRSHKVNVHICTRCVGISSNNKKLLGVGTLWKVLRAHRMASSKIISFFKFYENELNDEWYEYDIVLQLVGFVLTVGSAKCAITKGIVDIARLSPVHTCNNVDFVERTKSYDKLVRQCCRFWQQIRILLRQTQTLFRHCCWCARGLRMLGSRNELAANRCRHLANWTKHTRRPWSGLSLHYVKNDAIHKTGST